MCLMNKASEIGGFLARQARFFWEVVMLKIRIIGFANKRSDLFSRLGKVVYSSPSPIGERDAGVKKTIDEIKETDREIKDAEEALVEAKKIARRDRMEFMTGLGMGAGWLTPEDPADEAGSRVVDSRDDKEKKGPSEQNPVKDQ